MDNERFDKATGESQLISTIERLKETLAGVASARQQVGDTVAAYGRTQKDIQAFVERLAAIEAALTNVVRLLNANRAALGGLTDKAAEGIGAACDAAAANAGRAVGDAVAAALASLSTSADRVCARVDALSSSLVAQADTVRRSVSSSVADLNGLAARFGEQTAALARQAEALCAATSEVRGVAATVADNSRSLADIAAAVKALRSEVATMRKAQAEELSDLRNAVKSNKMIGVATLILVIFLSVIFAFLALVAFGIAHF